MENRKTPNKQLIKSGAIILIAIIIAAGFLYYKLAANEISIEKSHIEAPIVQLSPTVAGQLEEVFVSENDEVQAYAPVARVGNEIIKTKVGGIIISVQKDIGKIFSPGEAVVTMIDPSQLRVIGTIEEDKGLDKIMVGQTATFTVDAFGSKKYEGIVDEISPTSNESSVAFSISDKREEKLFDIKVRFDHDKYPELKNGMSAKLTIYR